MCVKTFDPNIDEDMIYRQIKSGKYSLRVIKYKNTEEITKYSRRAEGGIVSRGNTKSASPYGVKSRQGYSARRRPAL